VTTNRRLIASQKMNRKWLSWLRITGNCGFDGCHCCNEPGRPKVYQWLHIWHSFHAHKQHTPPPLLLLCISILVVWAHRRSRRAGLWSSVLLSSSRLHWLEDYFPTARLYSDHLRSSIMRSTTSNMPDQNIDWSSVTVHLGTSALALLLCASKTFCLILLGLLQA